MRQCYCITHKLRTANKLNTYLGKLREQKKERKNEKQEREKSAYFIKKNKAIISNHVDVMRKILNKHLK